MNMNNSKSKLFIIIILFSIKEFNIINLTKKKIGVIGLEHSQNVGNNLLKYAMFIKLSELGFSPYIVGKQYYNHSISFINKHVNLRVINNFSEIKEKDFDILMVNSDQTWRRGIDNFYDVAFLRFAKDWNIPKFTYGTSFGHQNWVYRKKDEKIAKLLLKNFTGLSVREKDATKQIKRHLGFNSQFVLDPTFLINESKYIDLIKNFKSEIINQTNNNNFIFAYILTNSSSITNYLLDVEKKLGINIFRLKISNKNQVEEFLFGITHCRAVITDSFHATVFSIIFKKPFISFINESNDKSRFKSLDYIFNIKNRIFKLNSSPPMSLLNPPLIVNEKKLLLLKIQSIKYLKKNLNHKI